MMKHRYISVTFLVTFLIIVMSLISGCIDVDDNSISSDPNDDENGDEDGDRGGDRDFHQEMRDLVQGISADAKEKDPDFIIIPQNGHELLTENGEPDGPLASAYVEAIDGVGREDLYYGYDRDSVITPIDDRNSMISFMDIAKSNGIRVLVTDYCSTPSFVDDSYSRNSAKGYISFAADHRELDNIPNYPIQPFNPSSSNIDSLVQANNFLYLLNPDSFSDKRSFLDAIRGTNYDLIIIDPFFDGEELTPDEVESLKVKANGGTRLIIAYMSIGEAENYRYYWNSEWELDSNSPSWLEEANLDWPDNYKVRYWNEEWQRIIYSGDDSYLTLIQNNGFDGVYLDIIDAFEYFEDQ